MFRKKLGMRMLVIVAVLALAFPMQALAAPLMDLDKEANVTIQCVIDDTKIPGMDFDIYYLAEADKYAQYTINEKFAQYEDAVDFSDLSGDNGDSIAATLEGYVASDGIAPIYSSTTDEEGVTSFKGKPGLYLVLGHPVTIGNKQYETIPFMVFAPQCNEENVWEYEITAFPKCKFTEIPDNPGMDITAVKAWNDEGFEDKRPEEVEFSLVKDKEVIETSKLNEKNNWQVTWTDLDMEADYSVTETPLDGYTVEIAEEEGTYVVTNTPVMVPIPSTPDEPVENKLPQTGLLWWPVFGLVILGLGLLIVGVIRKNRSNS